MGLSLGNKGVHEYPIYIQFSLWIMILDFIFRLLIKKTEKIRNPDGSEYVNPFSSIKARRNDDVVFDVQPEASQIFPLFQGLRPLLCQVGKWKTDSSRLLWHFTQDLPIFHSDVTPFFPLTNKTWIWGLPRSIHRIITTNSRSPIHTPPIWIRKFIAGVYSLGNFQFQSILKFKWNLGRIKDFKFEGRNN